MSLNDWAFAIGLLVMIAIAYWFLVATADESMERMLKERELDD